MTAPILKVEDLSIAFGQGKPVVDSISFDVARGETLAIVGESGSGKTLSCRAILQLLPRKARITSGRITLSSAQTYVELTSLSDRKIQNIRGDRISMIFQEPMRALSPLHRIGDQVTEVLHLHNKISKRDARDKVMAKFERVGFADPERAFRSYPFEMSGGMRQRAMIAMAMVSEPDVLIADEPTTALDVTTQAQVLGLMKDLQRDTGMAMILVTHDLGVVANMAEQVVVMHKGRVMEAGSASAVLGAPAHPYTQTLFDAAPAIPANPDPVERRPKRDLILQLKSVAKTYALKAGWGSRMDVQACRGIDLDLARGRTLAIVGESGSGKTTAARIALGAEAPDPGSRILFTAEPGTDPLPVHNMTSGQRCAFQRQAQMVFQDPYSSLSPRMRIIDTLSEPLEIHGIGNRKERRNRAVEMLERVGLGASMLHRYPHAFSGGQRQRLSIARALMLDPKLLVCDEPTSALDVSVQEQILQLLERLQNTFELSYLFISHDLAVVARIADEVAVMRQGLVVEKAAPEVLFNNPKHPYTRALIAAQPEPDINRPIDLKLVAHGAGAPQSWPQEFRFYGPVAPELRAVEPGHMVRAHA